MAPTADPFYNRKPVPDDFIEHVGPTGLSKQDEYLSRERKFSTADGDDVRRFSNPKTKDGKSDPHYARRQVPDEMIRGVGLTGLSPEEEHWNREKKFTANGTMPDVRRFSTSMKGGMEPQSDPFYGRKPVAAAELANVPGSGNSRAEDYEVRERKQSMFQESTDPFQQLAGTGHRQSISGVASAAAADARRRSSAIAPDAQQASANVGSGHHPHSGYGGEALAPIESRTDDIGPTDVSTAPAVQPVEGGNGLVHEDVTKDVR